MSSDSEAFVVDKWCLLGKTKEDNPVSKDLFESMEFDVDSYKILERFILSAKNQQFIKPFQQKISL